MAKRSPMAKKRFSPEQIIHLLLVGEKTHIWSFYDMDGIPSQSRDWD